MFIFALIKLGTTKSLNTHWNDMNGYLHLKFGQRWRANQLLWNRSSCLSTEASCCDLSTETNSKITQFFENSMCAALKWSRHPVFFQKMMLSLGRNKLKNDILKLKMCMQFSNQSRKHTASELLLKNNKLKKYVKRCNSVAVSFFSCEMGNCERNLFRATNLV